MMLVEQTQVPQAALPVAEFKNHLRLGTGFADDGVQDAVLESLLRAAFAAIEARTGKVTITRAFVWTLARWRALSEQALPVAPVSTITAVKTVDRLDQATVIDPSRYHLQQDGHRPRLMATGACLPSIPIGGQAEVDFDAGFGPAWSDLPADLAQAVMLLGAHYYEHRADTAAHETPIPYGIASLIERFRIVRILGGGAS